MKQILVLFLVLPAVFSVPFDSVLSYARETQSMADYVNSLNTTWKAAPSPRFAGVSEDYVKGLCGTLLTGGPTLPVKDVKVADDIPDTFDAREQWPGCSSISDIRDQGSCGSCWVLYNDMATNSRLFFSRHSVP